MLCAKFYKWDKRRRMGRELFRFGTTQQNICFFVSQEGEIR